MNARCEPPCPFSMIARMGAYYPQQVTALGIEALHALMVPRADHRAFSVGTAIEAAGNGVATVRVRLNGVSTTAA